MSLTVLNTSAVSFTFGLVADALLNVVNSKLNWNVGLTDYFKLHGPLEATFIAAALMFVSMWIGLTLWGGDVNRQGTLMFLFIYGLVIDNFFRYGRLMPTLDPMYKALSPPVSMFWAGGPLAAAYLIAKFIYV